jgi:hypothetical protein
MKSVRLKDEDPSVIGLSNISKPGTCNPEFSY